MDSGLTRLSNCRPTAAEPRVRNPGKAAPSFDSLLASEYQSSTERTAERASEKSLRLDAFGQIDFFNRKGWRSKYSETDAATGLWLRDRTAVNPNDPSSVERFRVRLYNDNFSLTPTEQELKSYIAELRKNGLDGAVDWRGLEQEFEYFQPVTYEYLQDSLNYLASRYVSVKDKVSRSFSGEEQAAELEKLDNTYLATMNRLIGGYIEPLQQSLRLSLTDALTVKASFVEISQHQIQAYESVLKQVHQTVTRSFPEDRWLHNHDAYIAARLREAGGDGAAPADGRYAVWDLVAIGQAAQFYQREINGAEAGARNEATLALNLALADMKTEALVQRGLIGDSMAALLRNIRTQGHNTVLDAADRQLAAQKDSRQQDEPEGVFFPINRSMFGGIYGAVMGTYQQNGGDAAQAIRAGATFGQAITAQAAEKNPQVRRWSADMTDFWNNFYVTPEHEELSQLERSIQQMLSHVGQSRTYNSTYRNYVNDWRRFLTAISYQEGIDLRA